MTLTAEPVDTTVTASDARDRRPRVRRVAYVAATAWYVVFIARTSFTVNGGRAFGLFDDGMISLTYARNLAFGHGLVWNATGPRVEGITNLGWTLVMAIPELLRVPDRFAALSIQLAGVAILLGCGALAGRITSALAPQRRHARTIATVLVFAYYPLVYWTLRGMEVGWLTLLLLALVAISVGATTMSDHSAARVAAVVAAIGVLTRLDFTLFVAVVVAWLMLPRGDARGRRIASRVAAGTALSVVGQESFRRVYYGAWLPNTYALKVGKVPLLDRLDRGTAVLGYATITSLAALLVLAWFAWRAEPLARHRLALVTFAAASAALYEVYVGGDAWEWMRYSDRYLAPAAALMMIPGAIGVAALVDHGVSRRQLRTGLLVVALAALATFGGVLPGGRHVFAIDQTAISSTTLELSGAVFVLVVLMFVATGTRRSPRTTAMLVTGALVLQLAGPAIIRWADTNAAYAEFDAAHARRGDFLRRATPRSTTMAVGAAGAIVFFSRRDAVDILGKMDPRIANEGIHAGWFFWPGHMKWDAAVTLAQRPDLVVDPWLAFPADLDALRRAGYTLWAITPAARRAFGLRASDGNTLFVAPWVTNLDRDVFEPRPFPQFRPTLPLLTR